MGSTGRPVLLARVRSSFKEPRTAPVTVEFTRDRQVPARATLPVEPFPSQLDPSGTRPPAFAELARLRSRVDPAVSRAGSTPIAGRPCLFPSWLDSIEARPLHFRSWLSLVEAACPCSRELARQKRAMGRAVEEPARLVGQALACRCEPARRAGDCLGPLPSRLGFGSLAPLFLRAGSEMATPPPAFSELARLKQPLTPSSSNWLAAATLHAHPLRAGSETGAARRRG
jgi:hypothetical protein